MDEIKSFLKGLVVFAIILILVIVLLTGGNILFFWSVFEWLQGIIQVNAGLDAPLAKGVAAIAMGIIVVLPLWGIILSFSPIPQKNSGAYRLIAFLLIAAFFLLSYYAGKDVFFDRETGKAMKYYNIQPNGEYKFYSEPGYDPVTGDLLKPVTKEVISKFKGWSGKETGSNYIYQAPPRVIAPVPSPTPAPPPVTTAAPIPDPDPETPKFESSSQPTTNSSSSSSLPSSSSSPAPSIQDENPTPVQPRYIPQQIKPENNPVSRSRDDQEAYSGKCLVTFKNNGNSDIFILNNHRSRICRVSVDEVCEIALYPGRYYCRPANTNRLISLNVPRERNHIFNFKGRVY
ncbi:MAG: hypothetical protein WCK59_03050 [Candidatus Falkowbacteria bacterium]